MKRVHFALDSNQSSNPLQLPLNYTSTIAPSFVPYRKNNQNNFDSTFRSIQRPWLYGQERVAKRGNDLFELNRGALSDKVGSCRGFKKFV